MVSVCHERRRVEGCDYQATCALSCNPGNPAASRNLAEPGAGKAVPFTPGEYVRIGEYAGFPVYARRGSSQKLIYLPTRNGLVAPYRRKQPRPPYM